MEKIYVHVACKNASGFFGSIGAAYVRRYWKIYHQKRPLFSDPPPASIQSETHEVQKFSQILKGPEYMSSNHPVIQALREHTMLRSADIDFIIENGQSYRGIPLPPGVKRWPLGECIPASDDFEARGLGRFITGFALQPGKRRPIRHAWVSPDGMEALDPTLSDPGSVSYWGLGTHHHDRVSNITALGFRNSTHAGIPLDLMPGALRIPGLERFVFKM